MTGRRRAGRAPRLVAAALATASIGFAARASATTFAASPADTGAWNGITLVDINFGPRGTSDGRTFLWGAAAREAHMGWTGGRVTDFIDSHRRQVDLRDGIEGVDARFSIGVTDPDATYRLTIWLADTLRAPAPVALDIGPVRVAEALAAEPNRRRSTSWLVRPAADRVSFRLAAPACKRFAVTAARLEGPAGTGLAVLFPDPDTTVVAIPPADNLPAMTEARIRDQLRRDVEHLLAERLSDGRFSTHGAWYQNSFPIRALVSAGELLDEPAWRETAFGILDEFVARQRPDGNWASDYDDGEGCLDHPAVAASANLADVGAMTLALGIAAATADDARRERWLAALVTYADSVSLPNQDESGGFCNRKWQNVDYKLPYTVATATQVSTLAALDRIQPDPRYAEAVARGTRWLAGQVLADGRIAMRPHDRDTIRLIDATHFGDCFYVMEALALVASWTGDDSLRREADAAFDRWLEGEQGLRPMAREGYWWPMGDLWADSKLAGIPALLARRARRLSPAWLPEMVMRGLAWLDDDERARRIGVRSSPAAQNGEYALAATGFAGLSCAAALRMRPGSVSLVE
jgi:hypothetical protein